MDNIDSTTPEPAVPFVYPDEQVPTVVEDANIRKLLDFITYYVLTSKSPQTTLIALCYAAGYDVGGLYHTNNTIRSIAKATGIVHVQLHKELKTIHNELQLKPHINNANRTTTDGLS